jgi:hypothetical protein
MSKETGLRRYQSPHASAVNPKSKSGHSITLDASSRRPPPRSGKAADTPTTTSECGLPSAGATFERLLYGLPAFTQHTVHLKRKPPAPGMRSRTL